MTGFKFNRLNIRKEILATLTYFNMFDYPLKKRELFIFLGVSCPSDEFDEALNYLISSFLIFKFGEFYSLSNNYTLVERRLRGNKKAASMLKKAEKAASLISAFPFVRGVAVSGSLSKHFADETTDIDFFIITATNRLWIARTFLHVFKKLTFLINRQNYFCMNYFVDESELTIIEKNIYTAIEVATVMPMRGTTVFDMFYNANNWTKMFLPNNYMRITTAREIKTTWFALFLEKTMNNRLGNLLDNYLMQVTKQSWDNKTRNKRVNSKGMVMGLHTGKHFSKPDPSQFQGKILERLETSLSAVFDQYKLQKSKKIDHFN